jgi:hypothetical protein
MIIKKVEEESKSRVLSMKTDSKLVTEREREFSVLLFRVVFARAE